MSQVYLSNALSLQMLPPVRARIDVAPIDLPTARTWASRASSRVGHQSTATFFAETLGLPVAVDRSSIVLEPGDTLLVGQYTGPRLAEGAVTLPEGASLRWVLVSWQPSSDEEVGHVR